MALTALERKKSGVNGVGTEKQRRQRRWNRKRAELTALEWKISGVNDVERKKARLTALERKNCGVNAVGTEKGRS